MWQTLIRLLVATMSAEGQGRSASSSQLFVEASEAPAAAARFLQTHHSALRDLGQQWRKQPPSALLTIARGSSDHAAHYMAYLVMARLGRLVTSLPMSLITLYQSQLHCRGLMALAFSQSGQSPDLVAPMRYIGRAGGGTLAFVNDAKSPLAHAAQFVFDLHAGPETSVAATKSFICQLVAGAALVDAWQDPSPQNSDFQHALNDLPASLSLAWAADWGAALPALVQAQRLYVVSRGTGLPVAMELALKFKEMCGMHAEAFSSAEVQHGPMALVEPGFVMLVLAPAGPAQAGLLEVATQMRQRGAQVLLAAPPHTPHSQLPLAATGHVDLDPTSIALSAYRMLEALAHARGLDPDQPRHLQKVTRTE